MSIELPKSDHFFEARESLEALVRANPQHFAPHEMEDDGEVGPLVAGQTLCDWVLVTHWIDAEGEQRYCRVNSTMTPHALKGLGTMFDD